MMVYLFSQVHIKLKREVAEVGAVAEAEAGAGSAKAIECQQKQKQL